MSEIEAADAERIFGIYTRHELMPSGERRFRLIDQNGVGYIRTEAGHVGEWQSSHAHNEVCEAYIVQQGWIAIADFDDKSKLRIRILSTLDSLVVSKGIPHNVYMSANSITHTVKFGVGGSNDWHRDLRMEKLDGLSKNLTEADIRKSGVNV